MKILEAYSLSSTQVNLNAKDTMDIYGLLSRINQSDLDPSEKGIETEPHITIKYGIHNSTDSKLRDILSQEPSINVTLCETSCFTHDGKSDVLKIDVESSDLQHLNSLITKTVECTTTYPDYHPHITLAYLREGRGKMYTGWNELDGKRITFDTVIFSSANGTKTEIRLVGTVLSSMINKVMQGGDPAQVVDDSLGLGEMTSVGSVGGTSSYSRMSRLVKPVFPVRNLRKKSYQIRGR